MDNTQKIPNLEDRDPNKIVLHCSPFSPEEVQEAARMGLTAQTQQLFTDRLEKRDPKCAKFLALTKRVGYELGATVYFIGTYSAVFAAASFELPAIESVLRGLSFTTRTMSVKDVLQHAENVTSCLEGDTERTLEVASVLPPAH